MAEDISRLGRLYAGLPKNPVKGSDGVSYTHQVPARDEARLLIEVDVFPINGVSIGGQLAKHGKSRLVIYASELPEVEKRVATKAQIADWEDAVRVYEAALESYVDGAIGKRHSPKWLNDPTGYENARKLAVGKYGDTTPSLEFARRHKGGRPPITSLSIIEELPAPTTQDNREAQRFEALISRFVDTLGKAVSQPKAAKAG